MKRLIAAVLIGTLLLTPINARAEEETTLQPVRVTAYCLRGVMKNGEEVHEGAAAYKPELIGRKCRIYNEDGSVFGEYTICDTGGKRIRKGEVVDIWMPDKKSCYGVTRNGFIEILPEEGGTENNVDATGAEVISGDPGNGGNGQVNPGGDVSSVD